MQVLGVARRLGEPRVVVGQERWQESVGGFNIADLGQPQVPH
jgi:hypothetical protein